MRAISRMRLAAPIALAAASVVLPAQAVTIEGTREKPQVLAVNADDVYVRSGPADSYYPFGALKTGDAVKVIGEKYGWARVLTVGPAFDDLFGYLRVPIDGGSLVRLSTDSREIQTLGRMDLLAPNLSSGNRARDSWKRIMLLPPETSLTLIEQASDEGETIYAVRLPAEAEGWISTSFLVEATSEQIALLHAPKTKNAESPARLPDNSLVRNDPRFEPDEFSAEPVETTIGSSVAQADPAVDDGIEATTSPPLNQTSDVLAKPEEKAPPRPRTAQEQLEDLEAAYKRLSEEPIESAEVIPLRELYLQFSEDHADAARPACYAKARAEQLAIWAELQKHRVELAEARKRAEMTSEEARATSLALEMSGDYLAVGKLNASAIYDGQRMPHLFRLQDAGTGRTIAYLKPVDEFDLTGMLGHLIGIIGEKEYDGGLRLNIIQPKRIDLLALQR